MRLTKYDLAKTKAPVHRPARHRGMYSIIDNEAYRADLATKSKAPVLAKRWGVSPNTVRQHRCNLRKRGDL